jgi:hypothetical protein
MRILVVTLAAVLALPVLAVDATAQPEDRRRAPTAGSTSVDPCAEVSGDRGRGPDSGWPGFDPRLPAPAGATSFTGVAPPGRDPSRTLQPLQPDQSAVRCPPRQTR